MPNRILDEGTKIQALTMLTFGVSTDKIADIVGISKAQINRLRRKAKMRGWSERQDDVLRLEHVRDEARPGRPRKDTPEQVEKLQTIVEHDAAGRHASLEELAYEMGTSSSTLSRQLKQLGYKKVKKTTKPGLTEAMRRSRLNWCLEHQHWTIEDWKKVIFTDETSIVLGQQRGRRRIWRKPSQLWDEDIVKPRFKKSVTVMGWGAFTWDEKGPFHIYSPETAAQKRNATAAIARLNAEREE